VYNSEGKPVFEVNALGYIKQSLRNSFGEIIAEVEFDTKINLDLSKYTETGISLSKIKESGVIIETQKDRIKMYARDNRGDVIETTMGKTFYYLPKGSDQSEYAMDYSITYQQYNAFRQVVCKFVLIYPDTAIDSSDSSSYAKQLYWFDRKGRKIAECDPVFRVIRRTYSSFDHEIEHAEWALPPRDKDHIMPSTSVMLLDYNHIPSTKDRKYLCDYDLAGNCIAKSTTQVVIQAITYDKDNIPSMSDLPPQDLTQKLNLMQYKANNRHL